MDFGNVCGLYLTVPWSDLEVVHERCTVCAFDDTSLYGVRLGREEVVEVLPFDQLDEEHVTRSCQSARPGDVVDLWRVRGPNYSFVLLEQHAALYAGLVQTNAAARSKRPPVQIGAASRLHGATGSGKSFALLYIIFRELARGRACVLLRRSGKLKLIYRLTAAEAALLGFARPRLLQVAGFEAGDALDVRCLHRDADEPEYIDWRPLDPSSVDFLVASLVRKNARAKLELTERTRFGLYDGAVANAARPALYIPAVLLTGHRWISQALNEWFWAGLSPIQVAACSHFCWKSRLSGSSASTASSLRGASLYDVAGVDLRLASVISCWENSSWVTTPIENVLSKMSLSELVSLLEVGVWTENCQEVDRANVVKCQLRLGAAQDWRYEPGNSCLPFMQRLVASELVRQTVMKRMTWFPEKRLIGYVQRTRNPIVFAALLRQLLHRRGLVLRTASGAKLVVPTGIQFVYGEKLESILADSEDPACAKPICYINSDAYALYSLLVKLPTASAQDQAEAPRGAFEFVAFTIPVPTDVTHLKISDAWKPPATQLSAVVHVRLARNCSTLQAMSIIKQSSAPKKHHVWILDDAARPALVSDFSVRPRLRWLLLRALRGMNCVY